MPMESTLQFISKLRRAGCDPFRILTFLEFRRQLRNCESVLDIGCGEASSLRWFQLQRLVGLEGYQPSYAKARLNKTHHEVVLGDARQLEDYFQANQFDACIAIDLIEHLTPEEGVALAQSMERIARKKSIIFTPNGFLEQKHTEADDLQHHHSGWEPRDMERLGYQVTGMLGPRRLRGEYHVLKGNPKVLWGLISMLGHWFWTRRHPAAAAALLCVKTKAPASAL